MNGHELRRRPAHPRRRLATPAASKASYIARAEACLAAASKAQDDATRALHEDECKLWLILARQRQAIEAVLQRYVDETEAAA